jgi:hypothetical protein
MARFTEDDHPGKKLGEPKSKHKKLVSLPVRPEAG